MYRSKLREQGQERFAEILEDAWGWEDALAKRSSYPAWPYAGPEYGNRPRVLVVGKAHEQWPSTSVGHASREASHLEQVSPGETFIEFKERFTPSDIKAVIEHLSTLNDTFIHEVNQGGFSSSFWTFARRLLNQLGQGFDALAWMNTFPFCNAPQGPPSPELKTAQAEYRSFVTDVAEILDADSVLFLASADWQHHAQAAIPGDWETFPAPLDGGRKASTWARCQLPSGAQAVRSWHPQGSPQGFLEALTQTLTLPEVN